MSGGQEERKRILVLTYIETFSAGNAVTPVYLEDFEDDFDDDFDDYFEDEDEDK